MSARTPGKAARTKVHAIWTLLHVIRSPTNGAHLISRGVRRRTARPRYVSGVFKQHEIREAIPEPVPKQNTWHAVLRTEGK